MTLSYQAPRNWYERIYAIVAVECIPLSVEEQASQVQVMKDAARLLEEHELSKGRLKAQHDANKKETQALAIANESLRTRKPSEISSIEYQKLSKRSTRRNEKGNAEIEYSDGQVVYSFEHHQEKGIIAFHVQNLSESSINLDPQMITITTNQGASSPCSFSHADLFGITPVGIGTHIKSRSSALYILMGCSASLPYLLKDRIKSITVGGVVVKK